MNSTKEKINNFRIVRKTAEMDPEMVKMIENFVIEKFEDNKTIFKDEMVHLYYPGNS
jgi:hypothetical protein